MHRASLLSLIALAPPLLAACGLDVAGPLPSEPPIRTDAERYVLTPAGVGLETRIAIAFENVTGETLHIANCRRALSPVLEKRTASGWQRFWAPYQLLCLGPPIVMEAGAVLRDTIHVWGALPGENAGPAFASDEVEGEYRIVLHSITTAAGGAVPVEYRVSNAFVLDDSRR